jgi:cell division septum initiation protein DivIVA
MTLTSGVDRRLTPDAVQAVAFPPARLGRRGCDEERVRAFCVEVERELTRLLDERTALSEEVQRLRRRVLGLPSGDAVGYRPPADHVQAVKILSKAQQTADQYICEAEEYGRQLAQDARRRCEQMLDDARSHAALVLTEAYAGAAEAAARAGSAQISTAHAGAAEAARAQAQPQAQPEAAAQLPRTPSPCG